LKGIFDKIATKEDIDVRNPNNEQPKHDFSMAKKDFKIVNKKSALSSVKRPMPITL